jgi:Zn-dependent peptidase ImmA (M78 family)
LSGERLRLARKRAGYSLRKLADRIDQAVTAQAIGKYERNEITPSRPVLLALATALGVTEQFLNASSEIELGRLAFRKHSGTTAQERSVVEAAVLQQVERYLFVEERLGLDSATWRPPLKEQTLSTLEQAEELAREVRARWKLGDDPIPNLTELLEQQGIKIILLPLPQRVSGLTCIVHRGRNRGTVPAIIINREHGLERRRLSMAHELAHRLFSCAESLDEEKAANRFAGAFLQPPEHLRREVGRHRQGFGVPELLHTKRIYRVSAAALVVRFRDLGIITNETLAYISRRWAALGEAQNPGR